MAIPAYMWLKDDGGASIKGSVDITGREGSIEILGFGHSLHLPTDSGTGKITGTRIHSALGFEKHNHNESIELRYEKITWKYCDGNVVFADAWNERVTA